MLSNNYCFKHLKKNRLLNRRYNSETSLLNTKSTEDFSYEMSNDFNKSIEMDDWIFRKEPIFVRTFSDSIIDRSMKKTINKFHGTELFPMDINNDIEFIKIDSNYNEAIQEVRKKF
jgi:hypothetical protein